MADRQANLAFWPCLWLQASYSPGFVRRASSSSARSLTPLSRVSASKKAYRSNGGSGDQGCGLASLSTASSSKNAAKVQQHGVVEPCNGHVLVRVTLAGEKLCPRTDLRGQIEPRQLLPRQRVEKRLLRVEKYPLPYQRYIGDVAAEIKVQRDYSGLPGLHRSVHRPSADHPSGV